MGRDDLLVVRNSGVAIFSLAPKSYQCMCTPRLSVSASELFLPHRFRVFGVV